MRITTIVIIIFNIIIITAIDADTWYGNAQIPEFQQAVEESSDDLTAQEVDQINNMLPESHDNRYYIVLGNNRSTTRVSALSNITDQNASSEIADKLLSIDFGKKKQRELEFAIGYIWNTARVDLEWLQTADITITGSINETTSPGRSFETIISGNTVIANLAYDIKDLYGIKCYGTGILALGMNKMQLKLETSSFMEVSRLAFGIGLGLGVRYNLISKLYIDIGARYINLGSTKGEAENIGTNRSLKLEGTRAVASIGLRLTWLI